MQRLFPFWVLESFKPRPQELPPAFNIDPRTLQVMTERTRTNLANLLKSGARIVAGVDSPLTPYAISLHGEMEMYVGAGFTPFQALQTATVNTAELLAADVGTVEPGKLADLAIVEGDPLTDIKAARNVRKVVKNGEVFDVERLIGPARAVTSTAAR
jgi:imidazolonepropionase-like amidohydrolase